MKILLTHRYFVPDTPPYAGMLYSIAKGLAAAGHDVRVFSTLPSYKTSADIDAPRREVRDGVAIHRIPALSENRGGILRALNAFWYALALFVEILHVRPDAVQAATFPPVIAGWIASLAARLIGARFVYHMQDLHPEVSLYSGGMMGRGMTLRIARWLDNMTLQRAKRIVVLSGDMKDTILKRGVVGPEKITVINNFLLDGAALEGVAEPLIPSNADMSIVFAGNIGGFQGLESVIDAAHLTADLPGLHWWFVGDGARKAALVKLAGDLKERTVFFEAFQPQSVALETIRSADLAMAALAPSIYRVSYPSKVLTYLAIGAPVLAIVEPDSELARMVEIGEIGFVAAPHDPDSIAAAARGAWEAREGLKAAGKRSAALYDAQFSLERALENWKDIYT